MYTTVTRLQNVFSQFGAENCIRWYFRSTRGRRHASLDKNTTPPTRSLRFGLTDDFERRWWRRHVAGEVVVVVMLLQVGR